MLRILLADHHPQALWALKVMLQDRSEFEVTGEVSDSTSLLAKVKLDHPDLVLVDWELPDQPMFVMIPQLHKCNPNLIVVMMSSKPEYGSMLLSAARMLLSV